jgi:hypothetical protein
VTGVDSHFQVFLQFTGPSTLKKDWLPIGHF